jgi:hypothetical protein
VSGADQSHRFIITIAAVGMTVVLVELIRMKSGTHT